MKKRPTTQTGFSFMLRSLKYIRDNLPVSGLARAVESVSVDSIQKKKRRRSDKERAEIIVDRILKKLDSLGLRRGRGTLRNPKRPNMDDLLPTVDEALKEGEYPIATRTKA
jgi:hypothetical protein